MGPQFRLLVADLDGTLVGSVNEFPLYTQFRSRINEFRGRENLLWAACTGRSRRSFNRFFSPMRAMGISPDYVILNHAYIYGMSRFGFVPHVFWNLHIHYRLWANRMYVRQAINDWYDTVTGGALGVRTFRRRKDRTAVRFDSEESAGVAVQMLHDKLGDYQHIKIVHRRADVDVEAVPFTKGLAVAELAGHLGIGREHILTIGDGYNDISMLDGRVAKLVGCPSNAVRDVKMAVHKVGGHIAGSPSLRGVMEVLAAYSGGTVESRLPDGVDDSPESRSLLGERGPSSGRRPTKQPVNIWLVAGIVYAVLVVFASFDLVPLSGAIMRPFRILESWFARLMAIFYG